MTQLPAMRAMLRLTTRQFVDLRSLDLSLLEKAEYSIQFQVTRMLITGWSMTDMIFTLLTEKSSGQGDQRLMLTACCGVANRTNPRLRRRIRKMNVEEYQVNFLRGKTAFEKYGLDGMDGVIEIEE